ncbi:MAG: hypothetical protein IJL02_05255 [Methanobrevibacter sp.]|uniref:hypothetical protein n=1 Tax=Methanobrevibacter sp. TaxID=66852 RepID=UPI0025E3EE08|nr:hypothetical protein [Methanobrevibacter sp.]MBQ6099254.1 hypothetical protein [Methanobrevibacter sp.]
MFNPIKKVIAWNLNRKQADIKHDIERFGYSDEILERQVKVNQKRAKYNITDESELVNEDYVQ